MNNRFLPRGERQRRRGSSLPALLAAGLALCLFSAGTWNMGGRLEEEGAQIAAQAVTRAVVQCYALEGRYPPGTAYLREHYGLQVDETKYIVHYEAFAANVMPQITVIPRGGGEEPL